MNPVDTPYLDVLCAAKYLGIAPATLYGWVHQRIVPFRKHGRRLVFRRDELDAWSDRQAVLPEETRFRLMTLHGKCGASQNEARSLKIRRNAGSEPAPNQEQ